MVFVLSLFVPHLSFIDASGGLRFVIALRKHVYSNIQKILQPKKENFQIKNFDSFHSFAQNIDCGYSLEPPRHRLWYSLEPPRRGVSNECPLSMF